MRHARDHSSPSRIAPPAPSRAEPRHLLLSLQNAAGNRAVSGLVQRQLQRSVALAPDKDIYEGKCDARFDKVGLRYSWSPRFLYNRVEITFDCGPEDFVFGTPDLWVGGRGVWGLETADGDGSAWVHDPIEDALDTIREHWDEEDGGFWNAYRTIKAELKQDVENYCRRY